MRAIGNEEVLELVLDSNQVTQMLQVDLELAGYKDIFEQILINLVSNMQLAH